jgi:hypothetical protein
MTFPSHRLPHTKSVSIHKWPFFRWAAFSAGFRLQRTLSTPRRKPLCGLAQRKKFSFMNWTLKSVIYFS